MSPERMALIEAFTKQSEGLEKRFEARTHKSDRVMPYRLFRPEAAGKLPLLMYLHGSGGLGDDNLKQLGLGNIFGTRVWLLPENQRRFSCYVVVPQTDRGWVKYDLSQDTQGPPKILPGLGDGARLALEIVERLCHDFSIGEHRGCDVDLPQKRRKIEINASGRNLSSSEIVFAKGARGNLDLFVGRLEIGKTAFVHGFQTPFHCDQILSVS